MMMMDSSLAARKMQRVLVLAAFFNDTTEQASDGMEKSQGPGVH